MFDDLFSSSKGPGVIGLLLGFIVLAGFTGLGLAVFDGRLNGDFANRQQSQIEKNQIDIEGLKQQKADYEEMMAERKELQKVAEKAESVQRDLNRRLTKKDELQKEKAEAETAKDQALAAWEAYKEEYRAIARERIQDRTFEEIKTSDGRIFENVTITKATPLEVTLRTSESIKRVEIAQLPHSIRDELQYDEEKAQAVAAAIEDQEQKLEEVAGTAVRIQRLGYQIRQNELGITRKTEEIEKNASKKVVNEQRSKVLQAEAVREWDQYRIDKSAGRSSRADDRARDKERRAEGLLRQNQSLDAQNDDLRRDIGALRGKIRSDQKELEELSAEVRRSAVAKP